MEADPFLSSKPRSIRRFVRRRVPTGIFASRVRFAFPCIAFGPLRRFGRRSFRLGGSLPETCGRRPRRGRRGRVRRPSSAGGRIGGPADRRRVERGTSLRGTEEGSECLKIELLRREKYFRCLCRVSIYFYGTYVLVLGHRKKGQGRISNFKFQISSYGTLRRTTDDGSVHRNGSTIKVHCTRAVRLKTNVYDLVGRRYFGIDGEEYLSQLVPFVETAFDSPFLSDACLNFMKRCSVHNSQRTSACSLGRGFVHVSSRTVMIR
mmetsp:Transcript_35343/g.81925  ORF Transcript_35343/g.81925 Transcript_35343/m.81925 type:complete len:263 (+) Transcript_35343:269-1057(+)